jgi:hypothetical protein
VSARCLITEGRHYVVDPVSGCWMWIRHIDRYGYGHAAEGELAHRRVYRERVGEIPAGLALDHLCRNRSCVNPAHLEPVTPGENNLRSLAARGIPSTRTTCSHGHDMTDAYVEPGTGRRKCRECRRRWSLTWWHRNRGVVRSIGGAA